MRTVLLVLACLGCSDLGRRVQTANQEAQDSFDAEHQGAHTQSKAAHTSSTMAEIQQSQAAPKKEKGAAALLAMLVLGLEQGADAFVFSNAPAVAVRGLSAGQLTVTQHGPPALEFRHSRAVVQMQLPREDWPNGNKWYRFFQEEGGDDARGYIYKTPPRYVGTRALGTYENSIRVTFTLPLEGQKAPQVRIIELLISKEKDKPSFAAVEATLPLNMNLRSFGVGGLLSGQERIVVTDVPGRKAQLAEIRPRDMIRAMSMPEERFSSKPWWDLMGMSVPEIEEGMAMLDNTGVAAFEGAIQANIRANGPNAKVVLLIERPSSQSRGNDDDWFKPGGGFPEMVRKSVFGEGSGAGQLAGAGAPGSPS